MTQAMLMEETDAEEEAKWEMCAKAAEELQELCGILAEITEGSSQNLEQVQKNVVKSDSNFTAGFKTLVEGKKREVHIHLYNPNTNPNPNPDSRSRVGKQRASWSEEG